MTLRQALCKGLLPVALCLGVFLITNLEHRFSQHAGKAFVTQSGSLLPGLDYDNSFGDNWESVRTFRLLTPLDKPLKVYIEEQPGNRMLYKSHFRQYVLDSLNEWNRALDGRLRYTFTNRRKDADMTFDWVSSFSDRYVAGITTYSVGHAAVEIKTIGVPEQDIKCNIMHEVGHALGISGHSSQAGDIMVGVRRWQRGNANYVPILSQRDVQAIRRLYSAHWNKGEDLYASQAQSKPVIAQKPLKPMPETLKPLDMAANIAAYESEVIRWEANQAPASPRTKQSAVVVNPSAPQFRYMQIFP